MDRSPAKGAEAGQPPRPCDLRTGGVGACCSVNAPLELPDRPGSVLVGSGAGGRCGRGGRAGIRQRRGGDRAEPAPAAAEPQGAGENVLAVPGGEKTEARTAVRNQRACRWVEEHGLEPVEGSVLAGVAAGQRAR